jgi:hypothetical protein
VVPPSADFKRSSNIAKYAAAREKFGGGVGATLRGKRVEQSPPTVVEFGIFERWVERG